MRVYAQEVLENAQPEPANTLGDWEISSVEDTRSVDFQSGKPIPGTGAGRPCDRCGRKHDVVYSMHNNKTQENAQVGSTCAPRLAGGVANLDDYDVKVQLKEQQEKKLREQFQKWYDVAAPLVKALPVTTDLHVSDQRDKWGQFQIVDAKENIIYTVPMSDLKNAIKFGRTIESFINYAQMLWFAKQVRDVVDSLGIPEKWVPNSFTKEPAKKLREQLKNMRRQQTN
jgi:hypothetical protein